MAPRLPRSPVERVAIRTRMTPGHGGGRSAVIGPEPRPLAPLPLSTSHVDSPRFASIVVAAADSEPNGYAGADFRCGGTDDNAVMDAVVVYADSLDVEHVHVCLLCGHYNFGDKVTLSAVKSMTIEGEAIDWYNTAGAVIDCNSTTTDAFVVPYEGSALKRLVFTSCDLAAELQAGNFTLEDLVFDHVKRPVVITEVAGYSSYVWYACALRRLVIGNSCGDGGGSYMIDANWSIGNSLNSWDIEGIRSPGLFATSGLLRLKQTASGPNMDYVSIVNNPGLFGALIDGWDQGPIIANNQFGFSDLDVRNIDDLVLVGNQEIGDLTLNTIGRFAHGGNIVDGTYSETAVTTKAGVSIGIT